jgi:hypothetical protein
MGQPEEAAGHWQQEKSQYFIDELNKKVWQKDTQFDILVLRVACPVCRHGDGINTTVPTTVTIFRGAEPPRSQFVECKCAENHDGRPAGQLGCGRWGMVTLRESEG